MNPNPPLPTQTPNEPPLAMVRGLGFAYGRGPAVIHDLDLDLYAGQVHCMLGDSGCGKSTLLRLLAGLERPTRGTVQLEGQTVAAADRAQRFLGPEKRAVGYVFQDYALFPHLSVRRNIVFGMRGKPRAERSRLASELLDRVGLAGLENTMPHTLSGGQQQRVALARALASEPRLMLLDEPFASLDAGLRDKLREITLEVLREANVATLLVTHDPAEAMVVADTISVIRQGQLILQGPPDQVCRLEQMPRGPARVILKSE
ncbi:MAG: ABC transporter ATP-binding protein [Planctomycetota bacterium]